ncbi:MAG: protein-disulfide reductase DsbD domain-containing protein [bacterium]
MRRLLVLLSLIAFSARAAPVRDGAVEAELIPEVKSIQPGASFWVTLRLKMDPHWHTYWFNAGDSGLGTKLKWSLPEGFEAGPILWPTPSRIEEPPLVSYGYEGEIHLLVEIRTPADLATASSADITAKASWLMCKDLCIPGKATLNFSLPVDGSVPATDTSVQKLFETARARLPVKSSDWSFDVSTSGNSVLLRAVPAAGARTPADQVYFFPQDQDIIDYAAPQQWTKSDDAYVLTMQRSGSATSNVTALHGVVAGLDKDTGIEVDATAAATGTAAPPPPAAAEGSLTLWSGLLAMFLGGMILNLMPCVFPVLSLKIVGFVEQAREEHGHASKHAAAFTAGVMVSMWVLAILLLSLRGQGSHAGWAFQMSNPGFVLGLIFLFLVLGLNMFGVFEMGLALTGAGGGLQAKKGLAGSFFSGLLTTVAGAPCAGPFLGTAIGFALSQSTAVGLLAFTAMGLGTAAPYAILSSFPALLKFIPKPGAWMETMKQLMGFPMLATAAWFASTFAKLHGGIDALIQLLFGAVLVGMAFWVLGKWAALHRSNTTRWIARAVAVALLVMGWRTAMRQSDLTYEPWSAGKVAELRKEGKPVFVDFTAEWCAICQVNKRVAVENPGVAQAFRDRGVTVLMADWTDQNEAVTQGLQEFNRAAVPLYVLYGSDPDAAPVILPQALTPQIIIGALEKYVQPK